MVGGALKGLGIAIAALGTLLALAGAAAAVAGLYVGQAGPVQDPDAEEAAQALLGAAATSIGLGLVLLVGGLVLNAAGDRRRHRRLVRLAAQREAQAARPAPAPLATPPAPRASHAAGKGTAAVGALAVAALLLGLVAFVALGNGGRAVGMAGPPPAFAPLDFDGAVEQAVVLPVAGPATADRAASEKEFSVPAGASSLRLELTWTPAETGAERLRVVVETPRGGEWVELGAASGPGPLVLDVLLDGATRLHYSVVPATEGSVVAEQPFHVRVGFA